MIDHQMVLYTFQVPPAFKLIPREIRNKCKNRIDQFANDLDQHVDLFSVFLFFNTNS